LRGEDRSTEASSSRIARHSGKALGHRNDTLEDPRMPSSGHPRSKGEVAKREQGEDRVTCTANAEIERPWRRRRGQELGAPHRWYDGLRLVFLGDLGKGRRPDKMMGRFRELRGGIEIWIEGRGKETRRGFRL